MKMRLTERDLNLMRWVNDFGFVTIDLVMNYLEMTKSIAYRRLRKLVRSGYLLHERLFHGVAGSYRVTLLGAQISSSRLPPLRSINRATYRHDLIVVQLSLQLLRQFGGRYVPERVLRQEGMQDGIGQVGHCCVSGQTKTLY